MMKEKENLIYGLHPVLEALKAGQAIQKIILQKDKHKGKIDEIKTSSEARHIKIQFLPNEGFRKYQHLNHQGIIAFPSPVEFLTIEELFEKNENKQTITYLLLDGVTDVRNLGAIIRNAESLMVDGLILPENNSATINETVVKTSAGAIYSLPICKVKHLADALMFLDAEQIKTYAITEKTDHTINESQFPDKTAFVLGDEGKGISAKILQACQEKLRIPLSGKVSSLNVSVATGIILYERKRQLA